MPLRSTTRWYLDPGLPRSVGLRPACSPPFGPHAQAVRAGAAPVDGGVVAQPVQQRLVQPFPDARYLPVTQPPPTGGGTSAARRFRQQPPRAAGAQDEDDAGEGGAVGDAGATTLRLGQFLRACYELGRLWGWKRTP